MTGVQTCALPIYTQDMISQHNILNKISTMLDLGELQSTLTKSLSPLTSRNLRKAHELVESGHMIGKVTVSNWQ